MGRIKLGSPMRKFTITDQSVDAKIKYQSWVTNATFKLVEEQGPIPIPPTNVEDVPVPKTFHRVISRVVDSRFRTRTI